MVKWLAAVALGTGCSYVTDSFANRTFSGDPFPIDVDTTSGAIVIGVRPDGEDPRTAVLDVLSPVTLIDRGVGTPPSITYPDLTLLGERGPGGPLDLPRAQLTGPQVLALHPCADDVCTVGTPSAPRSFDALIGMNVFGNDALRLRLASDQLFILPDIAGDEVHRTNACDAVLPSPFRGGGTLLVGGTELGFVNWRVAVDACLAPNPMADLQSSRGADVLLVLSTAIGVSILDETGYARFRQVVPAAPALETLPSATVNLPSGPTTGKLASLPSLALVGNSPGSPRAPCRQVFAHHLLATANCPALDHDHRQDPGAECPCTSPDLFCGVPAILELAPVAGIDVLVVSDADPTLQALRTELRPDQPEVDGILGTTAMRSVELDLDYLHARLVGRCSDVTTCTARPELIDEASRNQVAGCLSDEPGPNL